MIARINQLTKTAYEKACARIDSVTASMAGKRSSEREQFIADWIKGFLWDEHQESTTGLKDKDIVKLLDKHGLKMKSRDISDGEEIGMFRGKVLLQKLLLKK